MSNCPVTGVPAQFCTCVKCQKPAEAVPAQLTRTGKKPCEECRHFNVRERIEASDRCTNPRAARTSVQGRTLPAVQREPGFIASFEWGGFCGKRGRWFERRQS